MIKQNKIKTLIIFISILLLVALSLFIGVRFLNKDKENKIKAPSNTNIYLEPATPSADLNNNTMVKTKSKSDIRIINIYDKNMFEGKKSILIMWASWCTHCQDEMVEIKKIIDFYRNSDITVFMISHDNSIEALQKYLETTTLDFNTHVLLDISRAIRTGLDPEENTIPVTYLLNNKAEIVKKINSGVTLDGVKFVVDEYLK